jgi:hypothetical protein
MRAVGAGEDASFAEAVDDVRGLLRGGFASITVEDLIQSQKQSRATHVADQRMLLFP